MTDSLKKILFDVYLGKAQILVELLSWKVFKVGRSRDKL